MFIYLVILYKLMINFLLIKLLEKFYLMLYTINIAKYILNNKRGGSFVIVEIKGNK